MKSMARYLLLAGILTSFAVWAAGNDDGSFFHSNEGGVSVFGEAGQGNVDESHPQTTVTTTTTVTTSTIVAPPGTTMPTATPTGTPSGSPTADPSQFPTEKKQIKKALKFAAGKGT